MTEPGDLDQRLEATRLELKRARITAAASLDVVDAARQSTLDELAVLIHAPSRRWLLEQRRRALMPVQWLRHPQRILDGTLAAIKRRSKTPRLRQVAERVFYAASSLRAAPFQHKESTEGPAEEMVRWLGPLNVHGVVRHALFAHPESNVRWTMSLERGARFVVDCSVIPGVAHLCDGVIFEATIASKDAGWSVQARQELRPRTRKRDQDWRRLHIPLPPDAGGLVEIQLKTSLPPDAQRDHGWSIWGDPRFEWRRPSADIARLAVAAVRREGVPWALRRLRRVEDVEAASYQRWIEAHTPTIADLEQLKVEVHALPYQPVISVLTPVFNTDEKWLRAAVESVRRQVYQHWELVLVDDASTSEGTRRVLDDYRDKDPKIKIVRLPANSHISAASNAGLNEATGEFIALLDHDDELAPEALAEVIKFINAQPDVDFIYSDEDKLDLAGIRCDPYFKPDWSPEHFLNCMYTNHLMTVRRSVVDAIGGFRVGFEGSQDYDLVLRVIATSNRIGHIPRVLYHWRRVPGSAAAESTAKPWAHEAARRALREHLLRTNQVAADVLDGPAPGLFRVKRKIHGRPLVSIVILTADRARSVDGKLVALLPTVIRSIRQKTLYPNFELIVVDDGRLSDATRDFLATVPHRRFSFEGHGEFNFSRKLNFSVRQASGEYLVLLNDDTEVISSTWLTDMLEYAQDPAIGAVGAKLFYADGRLQHAGIVLGVNLAAHVFHQSPGRHPGYAGSMIGPRNYSAVSAACLMTRRAAFDEMGGFNEDLPIDFNDVDFCLKLRRAGYRIVFTPYAELYHYESTSVGHRAWSSRELDYMRRTWAEVIAADPYYNVNLTRDFPDYRLGT